MYIVNEPELLKESYKCNAKIGRYLVYTKHLPLLHQDKKYWYFAKTEELEYTLNSLPILLKIFKNF